MLLTCRFVVVQVQDQNQSLRDALEKETNKPVAASSAAAEMIDFKKMFAETKAHSRAIDMELRQCEVEESRYLNAAVFLCKSVEIQK